MRGVSQRIVTNEVGFGRLQRREQLGKSRHCRALRPLKVDGERKARSEGASCLRQESQSYHWWEKKNGQVGLNESWLVLHACFHIRAATSSSPQLCRPRTLKKLISAG